MNHLKHLCLTVGSTLFFSINMAHADQVILDDLIVDGSACIGFDCVNGESFGFDTIRLKENNMRIRAVDTSTTSSFPSRDWQITFNDSANGGANKFSIDDIDGGRTPFTIEAGAPSHSLYVDDGGRLGLGTSTPVVDVHVKSGNTPTLRLEQDGSSGFTPQTWDVAGNEAGFFVRDATNGSTLPFRILPGASSQSLVIDGDDEVGIGAGTNPQRELHIMRSSATAGTDPGIRIQDNNESWDIYVQTDSDRFNIRNNTTGNVPFKIDETADSNLLLLGTNADSSRVDITGVLYLNGTELTPDYVFEPSYKLESIEDHAEYMWENKHLPSVSPAKVNDNGLTVIQVGARTQGMLKELEKAHIYIEQLSNTLSQLRSEKYGLEERLTKIEEKLR